MTFTPLTPVAAETLIRNIPSILLVFDNQAELVTWNTAARLAFGMTPQDPPPAEISPELTAAVRSSIVKALTVRVDQCVVHVGTAERVFGFTVSPVEEGGERLGAVATGRDITERLRVDEEIDALRQRVGIEKVARQIVHALRNPLNAVKAHAQFIELTFPEGDPGIHYAKVISEEVDRIDRLLTTLKELSHAREIQLRLQTPEQAVRAACALTRPLAEAKGAALLAEIALLPAVLHDEDRLSQVLLNLLKNAVEAVDYGGKVLLRAMPDSHGGVTIDVLDDGPGIAPDIADRIFDLFFTTKGRANQGVGLSLCQEIIEGHRGTLTLVKQPDWATCFRVEIPPP